MASIAINFFIRFSASLNARKRIQVYFSSTWEAANMNKYNKYFSTSEKSTTIENTAQKSLGEAVQLLIIEGVGMTKSAMYFLRSLKDILKWPWSERRKKLKMQKHDNLSKKETQSTKSKRLSIVLWLLIVKIFFQFLWKIGSGPPQLP